MVNSYPPTMLNDNFGNAFDFETTGVVEVKYPTIPYPCVISGMGTSSDAIMPNLPSAQLVLSGGTGLVASATPVEPPDHLRQEA